MEKATYEDFMSFRLHEKNIEEIQAFGDIPAEEVLPLLWNAKSDKRIVTVDGKTVCLLGVAETGEIWLFFASGINLLPMSFFKLGRQFVGNYEYLYGNIYSGNTFALEWAKFMGFTIEEAKPFGMYGKLFHGFYKGGGI